VTTPVHVSVHTVLLVPGIPGLWADRPHRR
jgi:hypothetical protein